MLLLCGKLINIVSKVILTRSNYYHENIISSVARIIAHERGEENSNRRTISV